MSQEFMSPVPPNDRDILQWIHEETVSPQVTVWGSECEGWGRGINVPMVSQPLFTGVRGDGSQQQATDGVCLRKKKASEWSWLKGLTP